MGELNPRFRLERPASFPLDEQTVTVPHGVHAVACCMLLVVEGSPETPQGRGSFGKPRPCTMITYLVWSYPGAGSS